MTAELQGQKKQTLIDAAAEAGVTLKHTLDEVYLDPEFSVFWHCWLDLSMTRDQGQVISWANIHHWAVAHNMRDFETLKSVVWKVDQAFMTQMKDKSTTADDQETGVLKRLASQKRAQ